MSRGIMSAVPEDRLLLGHQFGRSLRCSSQYSDGVLPNANNASGRRPLVTTNHRAVQLDNSG